MKHECQKSEWEDQLTAVSRQTFMLHDGWKSVLNEWTTLVKHNVSTNSSSSSGMDLFQEPSIFKKSIAFIKILHDFSLNLLFKDKFQTWELKRKNIIKVGKVNKKLISVGIVRIEMWVLFFFDNVAAALIKISWSICLYEWSHATSWELSQTKINTEQTGSL